MDFRLPEADLSAQLRAASGWCRSTRGRSRAPATPAARSSAALTAWPLNVRVAANSPSLSIICSVTYTGINFLPLCTAIVWPIMSGRIVDRRDHVLITFFSFRAFIPATFIVQMAINKRALFKRASHRFSLRSNLSFVLRFLFILPPGAASPTGRAAIS